jgi:hypothetical protein
VAGTDTPIPSPAPDSFYHQQFLKLFSQPCWFNCPAKGVRLIVPRLHLFPTRRVAISAIAFALYTQQRAVIFADFDFQAGEEIFPWQAVGIMRLLYESLMIDGGVGQPRNATLCSPDPLRISPQQLSKLCHIFSQGGMIPLLLHWARAA